MQYKLFPSLFDRPEAIVYSQQEPNEQLELVLRRHFATNLSWIAGVLIGLILPPVALIMDQTLSFGAIQTVPAKVLFAALILYYLYLLAYAIEKFLYWYFNIYIVTNFHIIEINFIGLLNKTVSENRLDDIQNVSTKIAGALRSLFNYGEVIIETAAKGPAIIFDDVPSPDFVADRIQELQDKTEPGSQDVA